MINTKATITLEKILLSVNRLNARLVRCLSSRSIIILVSPFRDVPFIYIKGTIGLGTVSITISRINVVTQHHSVIFPEIILSTFRKDLIFLITAICL